MATSFTMVKKGYEPKEVQEYIRLLEKELESYKNKEQFISQALVEAQVSAKNVIEQAEQQAIQIEEDAFSKLEHVKEKIEQSKEKLYKFQDDYSSFIKRFSSSFNDEELNKLLTSLDSVYATLEGSGSTEEESDEDDMLDSAI